MAYQQPIQFMVSDETVTCPAEYRRERCDARISSSQGDADTRGPWSLPTWRCERGHLFVGDHPDAEVAKRLWTVPEMDEAVVTRGTDRVFPWKIVRVQ